MTKGLGKVQSVDRDLGKSPVCGQGSGQKSSLGTRIWASAVCGQGSADNPSLWTGIWAKGQSVEVWAQLCVGAHIAQYELRCCRQTEFEARRTRWPLARSADGTVYCTVFSTEYSTLYSNFVHFRVFFHVFVHW